MNIIEQTFQPYHTFLMQTAELSVTNLGADKTLFLTEALIETVNNEWKVAAIDSCNSTYNKLEYSVGSMTRWHLKCEQDGTLEDHSWVVGDAFVRGKL